MRAVKSILVALAIVVGVPWIASAQATLSGVVRDTSGAVLPGVTVEATSPVLIEKSRTAVTDGQGRYQIVDLRPGTYTVTFTLPSFSVVKRDDVVLTGTAVTTVNADLRVGTLQETVTVTGETPVVDVQSSTRNAVINKDLIDALPTSRNSFSLGVLIPGMYVRNGFAPVTDVGGSSGPDTLALNIHGGKTEDQRLLVNGVALSTMIGGGWGGGAIPNATGLSEVAYDYSAVDASISTGGVRINFIPRDGGNRFSGTIAGNIASDSLQPDTFVDVTRANKTFPDFRASTVKRNGEFNPGVGGPFVKDKLWFFGSGRYQVANTYVTGMFHNKNAGDPTKWTYEPDLARPATYNRIWHVYQGRLTWQAAPKHKIGLTYDLEDTCTCNSGVSGTVSPEAGTEFNFPLQRFVQLDWNSPLTNRLLIEASGIHRVERWGVMHLQHGTGDVTIPTANMVPVNDTGKNLTYRAAGAGIGGGPPYLNSWNKNLHYRAAISYITGSHSFKAGFNNAWGHNENTSYSLNPYGYTFFNGAPTQITEWATPYLAQTDVDADFGMYAQDRWNVRHFTIMAGIRYDYFANSYPATTLGPGTFTPSRNIVIDEGTYDYVTGLFKPGGTPNGKAVPNLAWKDVTPRLGVTWDVGGNGKTAIKTSLNKYLVGLGTFSFAETNSVTSSNNPVNRLANNVTRPWADDGSGGGIRGDFIPQCNLVNPAANGECGAIANPNFGLVGAPTLTYDSDYLNGWNKRNFNWEFSLGVQREIAPRVSAEVSYFRRWYGNYTIANNLAYNRSDFTVTSLNIPSDPLLPGGGGGTLQNVYYLAGFPKLDNWKVSLTDKYGKRTEHWDGIDVTGNARLRNGLTLQGGVSTGKTVLDNCDLANDPELAEINAGQLAPFFGPLFFATATPLGFCHQDQGFITQIKGLASYVIPRIDVQVAGTYQGLPGPMIVANYNAPLPTALLPFPLKVVQIVEPGAAYGDRMNQFDFRISKVIRFAKTRTNVGMDMYNLLNSTPVLSENATYPGPFRTPLTMLQARFFKFSAQFDW
jgi:carboxypeptidase family protein